MYVSNRYPNFLGKWLDELSVLLMSPSLTIANHFASCYISTIYDKKYPQYKLLEYFIFGPIYAIILAAALPFGVLGALVWLFLCCMESQNKYTYVSFQEKHTSENATECRNVFTFASANVLLAPELLGRINNVKGAYSRAIQIAERILTHRGKHIFNLEDKGFLMSKYSSVKAEFPVIDFLCLQEVWERAYSLILIDKLKEEFPYFIYDIGDYSFKTNYCMLGSGLFFASKKPIIEADFKVFTLRTKHAKYTSQGILCTKLLLFYDKGGTRHVGYVANVHTQAYQGTEAVIVSQLSEILVYTAVFRKHNMEQGDVVDFDIICGDFNADNMSPGDVDVQNHVLFEKYCDVCMKEAGEDEDWAIGTELRQQMLFKPDISDPYIFKDLLIDDSLRRLYVLDADVLIHSSSLVTRLLEQSLDSSIKPVSYGGMRRIDRILYKNKSNVDVVGYCFLSALTNLTDHLPYKLKSMLYVSTGAFGIFSAVNIYQENEKYYDNILMPFLHTFNPEAAHNIAIIASKYGLIPRSSYKDTHSLNTQVWELNFVNPVGIAAGFDKQGEVIEPLHHIGFGFVEIGSVTPVAQPGNAKPRVFRLVNNEAIINRYGFNSDGHDVVYNRLKDLKHKKNFPGIVGVNLGKNRDSEDSVKDYVTGIKKFGDVADYLVINISSPNTPGLRSWQKKQQLEELLKKLVAARNELAQTKKPPLLLKLAPDLTEEERKDIADVLKKEECSVDGLVISNTTIERMPNLSGNYVNEEGGLSGKPLTDLSTALIADMYRLTEGRLPIIGVGGVFTGKDAYDKIRAGASLIQVYTAIIYHGPPRVSRIKKELDELIRADGLNSVEEAVGKGLR